MLKGVQIYLLIKMPLRISEMKVLIDNLPRKNNDHVKEIILIGSKQ